MWEDDGGFDGFRWHVVDDNKQNVIVYERIAKNGDCVIVVINFSPVRYDGYRFGANKGTYTARLSSDISGFSVEPKKYAAEKKPSHGFDYSLCLDIMPMSGLYLVKKNTKGRGK